MKTYSFAKVSARGYLTQSDYNNRYIITDDPKLIINVSGRDFDKPKEYFQEKGIIAKFTPLTEKNGDMGYQTILNAVRDLLYWDKQGKRSLVCCAFGVNRSRTVIEAFHFAKMGFHIDDEYDEFQNHLICNCMSGFLPPLSKVEADLRDIAAEFAD